MTNFFDRKTIALDRGFITYNPVAHKWVSVTGGKFAYTWIRTPMTFDSDLNPEGFSEKFSFDLHSPVMKNFTLMGMQLLFNESSRRHGFLCHRRTGLHQAATWPVLVNHSVVDGPEVEQY